METVTRRATGAAMGRNSIAAIGGDAALAIAAPMPEKAQGISCLPDLAGSDLWSLPDASTHASTIPLPVQIVNVVWPSDDGIQPLGIAARIAKASTNSAANSGRCVLIRERRVRIEAH